MRAPDPTASWSAASPSMLAAAPHRLLFFVGATNVLLATAWWLGWLLAARNGWPVLANTPVYAGWLHAVVMQYQLFPAFFFGFLLTVFPRWMGLRDFNVWHYVPVGVGLLGGQLAVLAGATFDVYAWIVVGLYMTTLGWLWGLCLLAGKLAEERKAGKGPTWHAWSCWAAMAAGFIGLLAILVYFNTDNVRGMRAGIVIGTWLLLLPVYFTVAHRMFPFFANNVVKGYAMWRPNALLGVMWVAVLAVAALHIAESARHAWLVQLPFAAVCAAALHRWWPRGQAPGLLRVLFIGFLWLPVALLLMGAQGLTDAFWPAGPHFGRGPLHALYIGFFGSLLVAMVTRVTQGHSGNVLEMTGPAWFAFVTVQAVALLRVMAEALPDPMSAFILAAALWLVAFLPWVAGSAQVYLRPRRDGKPG